MAFASRVDFSSALATAVVETASALPTSERPASWQVDAWSVEAAWTRKNSTPYSGETRAATTLGLVKALLMAHNEAPDPILLPNPGGRVSGTQPGETATQRQSRTRGRNRVGGSKNIGGGDHHHRRRGDSGDGGGGGTSGACVAEGAA